MFETPKSETYVTFKWLIGTMLATLAICVSFIGVVSGLTSASLDNKVNKEVYSVQYQNLCGDMNEIKKDLKANGANIDKVARNQELVLRALKIEPAK